MEDKIKVYVAGPFFHDGERERIEMVRTFFNSGERKDRYDLFVPMDHFIPDGEKMSNMDWAKAVFKMDTEALEKSDLMVAVYDKHYSDSGTAWELGYAYGLGIPVILLCTDLNADNSIMPVVAADTVYDFQKFINDEYFDVNTINSLK